MEAQAGEVAGSSSPVSVSEHLQGRGPVFRTVDSWSSSWLSKVHPGMHLGPDW